MPEFARFFLDQPDSSLLYASQYDSLLVAGSLGVSIFAAYAAVLVSQHVAKAASRRSRSIWLAIGGACLGLGIWAMHFIGMLALSLPCTTGYDTRITLLSVVPSLLASTLALSIISKPVLSRRGLWLGSLLLGSGIGAMHYTGMAAMQIEGLVRYDFGLFLLSLVVAISLAALAIRLKFWFQTSQNKKWMSVVTAATLGLAVAGMHYTAMAAAYFVRDGDSVTNAGMSQISIAVLSSSVVAATCLMILITIVATYMARPKVFSLGLSYKLIGLFLAIWVVVAWVGAGYYGRNQIDKLYRHELINSQDKLDSATDLISESVRQIKAVSLVYSKSPGSHKILSAYGPNVAPSKLAYDVRKTAWTGRRDLQDFNRLLKFTTTQFRADVIWLVNAAGDCVASSNFDKPDSFIGTNYAGREYFQQARSGAPGQQYAVGMVSKLPGLFYAYPIFDKERFVGAVVVKSNISNFSGWINKSQTFITDANEVVVLAHDKNLLMRAMPGAAALGLTEEQKNMQYGTVQFRSIEFTPWGDDRIPYALRIDSNPNPNIYLSKELANGLITVHVLAPLVGYVSLVSEKYWLFGLLWIAGSVLLLGVWVWVVYYREARKSEDDLRIAATAFDSNECMMITNADCEILRVNKAFRFVTGFSEEEVLGKIPGVLKSARHDAAFYDAMWTQIQNIGSWQGEVSDRRKNGEIYPAWFTMTAVKDRHKKTTHYVCMVADITQRKAAEEEIAQLAFYDPLTQLPNRRLLNDRLHQSRAATARTKLHGSLLFIDLDNFKTLNDTMGHDIGDLLLQQVAMRLSGCVREVDTVARLGGDEFVVMLEGLSDQVTEAAAQAQLVGEKILASLNQSYELGGHKHHSTPSIGITLFSDLDDTVEDLLKRADLAMYQAKASGRNTLRFFDPQMQAAIIARAEMEADLREAIRSGGLVLYYQGQINSQGEPFGAEVLLRWEHPSNGKISPAVFIPMAEETGLIVPLGELVLKEACLQLKRWEEEAHTSRWVLAVNVSPRQFHDPNFVAMVLATLERSGANPKRLKLELTEGLLVKDIEATIAKMTSLKAHGIGFSLDDFGTGYSSLSYLKRLPLDQLKIDQSFVRDVFTDTNDAAIVRTIVALGQSLGLDVIAEGVETEAQRSFLAAQGCHLYQGYLFGRPVPIEDFYPSVSTTGA